MGGDSADPRTRPALGGRRTPRWGAGGLAGGGRYRARAAFVVVPTALSAGRALSEELENASFFFCVFLVCFFFLGLLEVLWVSFFVGCPPALRVDKNSLLL